MKRYKISLIAVIFLFSLFNINAFAAAPTGTPRANLPISDDAIESQHIKEADGTSGQDTNTGSGVKTGHIQDGAVTTSKIFDGAVTDAKITGPISGTKISSTGLDADTVDGKHASDFAPANHTHYHGGVAVVAKSGGDYTSPLTAMVSAYDADYNLITCQ
jgi:hypothetical protein